MLAESVIGLRSPALCRCCLAARAEEHRYSKVGGEVSSLAGSGVHCPASSLAHRRRSACFLSEDWYPLTHPQRLERRKDVSWAFPIPWSLGGLCLSSGGRLSGRLWAFACRAGRTCLCVPVPTPRRLLVPSDMYLCRLTCCPAHSACSACCLLPGRLAKTPIYSAFVPRQL